MIAHNASDQVKAAKLAHLEDLRAISAAAVQCPPSVEATRLLRMLLAAIERLTCT